MSVSNKNNKNNDNELAYALKLRWTISFHEKNNKSLQKILSDLKKK